MLAVDSVKILAGTGIIETRNLAGGISPVVLKFRVLREVLNVAGGQHGGEQ
jgi:hypothetical protein